MFALFCFVLAVLASPFKSKSRLEAENAALRHADPVGENHIRARLRSGDGKFVNAIAFRVAGTPLGRVLLDNRGRQMHAAGFLAVDRWQGEERVQMRLIDVAVS